MRRPETGLAVSPAALADALQRNSGWVSIRVETASLTASLGNDSMRIELFADFATDGMSGYVQVSRTPG